MQKLTNLVVRSLGLQIRRAGKARIRFHERFVRLEPNQPARGHLLLAYVLEPFVRDHGEPISNRHTHDWESWQIAQTFLERGFVVDVISYLNRTFVPRQRYDFFIGARTNFERIARALNDDCTKVVHLDTAHWLFNNHAAYRRLLDVQGRRGSTLDNLKMIEPNWALEHADMGTVLGNDFTMATYQYAGKPLFRIPISTTDEYEWGCDKDVERARHRYLWFGSSGFVHKGLDLVLEAFAAMPEKQLVVCGPFDEEQRFLDAYHLELFETPNIEPVGWVDVSSRQFREIAQSCIGLIYPTCSEGGGGSALTCMHAGLIPVVPREASLDTGSTGVTLQECTVPEIKTQIRSLSDQPADFLSAMIRSTWHLARTRHTRPLFAEAFACFVDRQLLARDTVHHRAGGP